MVTTAELLNFLNALLSPEKFDDYAPNGLQVEGRKNISTLITGVTASKDLIDAAIEKNADAILVHHGYFWRGESPVITGIKRSRLKALLVNDINLFGYHLPLDAHLKLGNNAQLAKLLGIKVTGPLQDGMRELSVGSIGKLPHPTNPIDFKRQVATVLERDPLHISGKPTNITSIAWCTGAAQSMLNLAVEHKVDAYLTGEVSENTVHLARESGVHFFAAGHHATERYGVKAVGEYAAKKFGINHHNIDIDNPV